MQGLSPTQKRVLTPTCLPEPTRLITFILISGLAVVLLERDLPIPEVLTLLGAVTLFTLAMAGSTGRTAAAVLVAAVRPVTQHILARAAAAS